MSTQGGGSGSGSGTGSGSSAANQNQNNSAVNNAALAPSLMATNMQGAPVTASWASYKDFW